LFKTLFYSKMPSTFSEIWHRQDLAVHEDRRLPVRAVRLLHERHPPEWRLGQWARELLRL